MTAKTSPARRAAFMAALAETGNRTLAAERAKVSQSWVTLHRATDPDFRAELDAAIATAKASFDTLRTTGDGMKPAAGWGAIHGEELVVRAGNGRRTQIARARLKQWTPRVEARFLAALAGCCNVRAACAAVGLTQASAYNHRRRWPAFAERWAEAMELGYLRIEAALIENACALFEAPGIEPDPAMPVPDFDAAIRLLRMHQRQVREIGKAPGRWRRPRKLEEVRGSILRKLEMIESARLREESGDRASDLRAVAHGARVVAGKRSSEG